MIRHVFLFIILGQVFVCWGQKQGIAGKVVWISGNQMPGPGKAHTPPKPIAREIYFYTPTAPNETKMSNGLFSDIRTTLVAKITSKVDGTFSVKLPAGEYSVFTKETDGFFANIYDAKGRINVVKVSRRKFTKLTIQVNYQAAY